MDHGGRYTKCISSVSIYTLRVLPFWRPTQRAWAEGPDSPTDILPAARPMRRYDADMKPNYLAAPVTVRDVLSLKAFDNLQLSALTAGDDLDREVRLVHSSELPDIDRFLSGGELLLTAGIGMGKTEDTQRAYVRRLADAGAAALVIEESGRMFSSIPAAAVDEASQWNLPIISLSTEIPFAQVVAEFHEIKKNQRLAIAEYQQSVQEVINDLLLDGCDFVALMEWLYSVTGGIVVLENRMRRIVTIIGDTLESQRISGQWNEYTRGSGSGGDTSLLKPVIIRGQQWGYIHVINSNSLNDTIREFCVERASTAIAISLLSERTQRAQMESRTTSLVTRLLLSDLEPGKFVEQARRIGFELGKKGVVVFAVNLRSETSGIDLSTRTSFLTAQVDNFVLCFSPRSEMDEALNTLCELYRGSGVGISRTVRVKNIPSAVRQAQAAAISSGLGDNDAGIVYFDNLGVERILVALGEGNELSDFVEDELSPLLDYDATSKNPLLPTLRMFLEEDGRKTDTANKLYVQRRTLYNRIDKLDKILGRSVTDPQHRQTLLLAVKGLDILSSYPGFGRRRH